MKRTLLLIVAMLLTTMSTSAVEVKIGGLWYDLVERVKIAKVIQSKDGIKYRGDIVIPENVEYAGNTYSVTSIGSEAFYQCSYLTSVTIPNSLTSIGESAFDYCGRLTSVHISDLEAWCKIAFSDYYSNPLSSANHLFLNGEEIKDLVIPNNVMSIGDYTFCDCSGLTSVTIPNSVTSIGEEAFCNCEELTSVTIPNSVTRIGKSAFSGCISLSSLTIPNSVTSIGDEAFDGSGLTSVTIPNSVTNIGSSAFHNCYDLTSVTIGISVKSIGVQAFEYCLSLTSIVVELENPYYDSRDNCNAIVETASNTLIYGCMNTVIPNNVTSIESRAFIGCSGLTSITIPNSVTSIGDDAFFGCI